VIPTPWYDAAYPTQEVYHLSKVGTYTLRFRINPGTGAACTTATDLIDVTTSQLPSSSNSGTPQLLGCNITQTHLAGNIPSKGTGTWSIIRYPAGYPPTIADIHDPLTLISDLYPGIYRFRWLIENGPACPPRFNDTRVIVANATPTQADAGPDQTVCYGAPIILSGNAPALNERVKWTVTPPGPVFSNDSSATPTVTGLAINTLYTFTYSIMNACDTTYDSMQVQTTFELGPVAADAGPDQCLQPATVTTATLAGNDPGAGSGTWRQVPAQTPPVNITFPNLPGTTVTGLTPGTYYFEWAISLNDCGPTRDTVQITVSDLLTPADAGPDRDICGDTVHLNGNTPGPGETGTWIMTIGDAGAVIEEPNSPVSPVSELLSGYYQFNWIISNGACTSNSDSVVIRVSLPPSTADAGPDRTLCGQDTVHLAATDPTSGIGSWNMVNGPNLPTFSSFTDPHATVSGLITGVYTFVWNVDGGPFCSVSTDTVEITVYARANAGTDQTLCDATTIELTGNIGSVGVWSNVSGPTVPTITPTVPASNKSTASPLITGTYLFEYSLSYPGCSSADTVSITISGQPTTAATGPEQYLCRSTTPYDISLTANTPDPGHGTGAWTRLWPLSEPGASFSDPTDPLATYGPAEPGLHIFRWTITDGSCSSSAELRVNLYEPPTPSDAGSNQEICGTTTTMDANLPTFGLGIWTQISGPNAATFTSVILPNTTVTGLVEGEYLFRWTIKNGTVCDSSTSTVNVKVHTNPDAPIAGSDQHFCETAAPITTVLTGNAIPPPGQRRVVAVARRSRAGSHF